jgi:hypothetical protein
LSALSSVGKQSFLERRSGKIKTSFCLIPHWFKLEHRAYKQVNEGSAGANDVSICVTE